MQPQDLLSNQVFKNPSGKQFQKAFIINKLPHFRLIIYCVAVQRKAAARHFNYCNQTDKNNRETIDVHSLLFSHKDTNNKLVMCQMYDFYQIKFIFRRRKNGSDEGQLDNYWLHFKLLLMRKISWKISTPSCGVAKYL